MGALEYGDALGALKRLQQRVHRINESAGRALAKGLEETRTLHRAGAYMALGRSLATTRVITRLAQPATLWAPAPTLRLDAIGSAQCLYGP